MKPVLVITLAALGSFLPAARGAASADPVVIDRAAAKEHFARAKAFWAAGRREDAARELDLAYQKWPDPAQLYNIGTLNAELGRPVEAAQAFERYLAEERSSLSRATRTAVESRILEQLAQTGTIEVNTTPAEVAVRLDGNAVGKTPLAAPLRAARGGHVLELVRDGYQTQMRRIEVQPQARVVVDITLPADPIAARRPGPPAPAPAPERAEKPGADPNRMPIRESGSRIAQVPATSRSRVAGTILVTAGLAAALAGGLLVWKFSSDANAASKRAADLAGDYQRAKTDYERARDRRLISFGLLGAGAIVGGLGWYLFFPGRADAPQSIALGIHGTF